MWLVFLSRPGFSECRVGNQKIRRPADGLDRGLTPIESL